MSKITIAAINLQSGVATTRGFWQYPLTGWKYWLPHSDRHIKLCGKVLKDEEVDVACISEISEKSLCTGFRSQTETLSESADMDHRHFFSSRIPFSSWRDEGNAVLSRHPLSNIASHPLHKELIGVALDEASILVEGKAVTVLIAHLALTKKHRQIQIKEIIDLVKGRTGPIILAGDFNEPDPKAFDELLQATPLKQMLTLKTFPSWKPTRSLDYVFLSEEFKMLDCYIPKSPAFSDHATLVVKAELF